MADAPIMRLVSGDDAAAYRPAIVAPLAEFNFTAYGPSRRMPFAAVLLDPQTETAVGGLYGEASFGWMFVQLLVVPEAFRGRDIGSRLLDAAEDFARERGCRGVWLDTFDFQARGFYEKRGYRLFGTLDGGGGAVSRYFMQKTL